MTKPTTRISVVLTVDDYQRLLTRAVEANTTITKLVRGALRAQGLIEDDIHQGRPRNEPAQPSI